MSERIQSVQALRFFAAAMVVYNHVCLLTYGLTGRYGLLASEKIGRLGAAGVDIFFVISGLVITLTGPLAVPRPTGKAFFWRRWSCVAPIFFVLTIPTLMTFGITGPVSPYGAGGPMTMPQTISTLLFWPAAGSDVMPPYLSQGWTLSLEMIFYASVSLVLIGGQIRRNLLIVTVIAAIFVGLRLTTGALAFRVLANRIFIEFGFGVALAMLLPRLRHASVMLTLPLLAIALAFSGAAFIGLPIGVDAWQPTLSDNQSLFRVIIFGAPAVCIVASALILERMFRGRLAQSLAWLGEASYSLYLVHLLVLVGLWCLWRAVGAPPPYVIVIAGMSASILGGIAVHRLMERPLLARLRRLSGLIGAMTERATIQKRIA